MLMLQTQRAGFEFRYVELDLVGVYWLSSGEMLIVVDSLLSRSSSHMVRQ